MTDTTSSIRKSDNSVTKCFSALLLHLGGDATHPQRFVGVGDIDATRSLPASRWQSGDTGVISFVPPRFTRLLSLVSGATIHRRREQRLLRGRAATQRGRRPWRISRHCAANTINSLHFGLSSSLKGQRCQDGSQRHKRHRFACQSTSEPARVSRFTLPPKREGC